MSDVNQKILLTSEGLEELKKEYHGLVEKKRPDLVDRLAQARELGDLSENSEYAAAKEDLAFVDGRIVELENILKDVKVVSISKRQKSSVSLGCKVHVKINNKDVVFTIVGEWEADPTVKKISHSSPLGKALIGKKVGDIAIVEAPAGKLNYKITKIE